MTWILGLTGGIASGKSTVSEILREYGAVIIDGDHLTHQLQQVHAPGFNAIISEFGSKYILPNGTLARKKLGNLVFNNKEALKRLNAIMKPLLSKAIINQIEYFKKQKVTLIVLDMPLLFEENYRNLYKLCDQTLIIEASPQIQLERLIKRDHLSRIQALARIKAQLKIHEKDKLATKIIVNNGTVEELKQKVIKWVSQNIQK